MQGGGRPMMVPDPQALATQGKVIDAQKELGAMQFSQNARDQKAKNAINYILLPLTGPDGVKREEPDGTPECKESRAACHLWLARYWKNDTDFELGIPVREATAVEHTVLAG